jgi:methylated-DNA-[protein]-cysteine S-methyltransferase
MAGLGYSIFDTGIGRCGIAWGEQGILSVHLPEAREIETRRRMLRQYPDAREVRPPLNTEIAIEGIVALLRGQPSNLSDVALDMSGVTPFHRRVYEFARTIPRGETLTFAEFANRLRIPGAVHAVGQAITRNPFTLIVPCHRVLAAAGEADGVCANGGVVSKRRLLSLEGALTKSGPTLFDVLLSVAPPRLQG